MEQSREIHMPIRQHPHPAFITQVCLCFVLSTSLASVTAPNDQKGSCKTLCRELICSFPFPQELKQSFRKCNQGGIQAVWHHRCWLFQDVDAVCHSFPRPFTFWFLLFKMCAWWRIWWHLWEFLNAPGLVLYNQCHSFLSLPMFLW